jgi:hypothetical protein
MRIASPQLRLLLPLLCLLLVISIFPCCLSFNNDDFDSYGPKIAGSDVVAAEIINQASSGGYVNIFTSYAYPFGEPQFYCSMYLDSSWMAEYGSWSMFAYGIAAGSRDTYYRSLVWWGENDGDSNGGPANWDTTASVAMTVAVVQNVTVDSYNAYQCDLSGATLDLNLLPSNIYIPATMTVSIGHEEFYQMAVQPEGQYAIAVANSFGFVIDLTNLDSASSTIRQLWGSQVNSTSPLYNASAVDSTFGPRAVALETSLGVVAGWVTDSSTRQSYVVCILFNHSSRGVSYMDRWQFSPNASDWRSQVQVGDTSSWKPQHDIAVAVRQDGAVMLGVQLFNSVWLFSTAGGRLVLQSSQVKAEKQVGFGKSISWTGADSQQAVILHNTYSLDYTTVLQSSTAEVYSVPASNLSFFGSADAESPVYVWPNPTQQLTVYMFPTFVTAVATPSNLFILDTSGNTAFVQSAPPGLYQPTVTGYDAQLPCPLGMYKNTSAFQSCLLCQQGTYRDWTVPPDSCSPCPASAFCPLGSVAPVNASMLSVADQGFVYPSSPDSTIYDDIIIQNMFFLHGPAHCVSVSPIFWGLLVLGVIILLLGCMFRLKYCVNDAKSRKVRRLTKFIFKRTDFVQEGEHWVGGLMSLVLIVFVAMGIWFTALFLRQYPYETASEPGFGCDQQWNAKFSSSLQSVALPADEISAPMYSMLAQQQLSLVLDLLNTNISCDDAAAAVVTATRTRIDFDCQSLSTGTISLTTPLPSLSTTLQFTFQGPQLVGGVRLSITGAAASMVSDDGDVYDLRAVSASQPLYSEGYTLQKDLQLSISLTKVINTTDPLVVGGSEAVSGLWIPVFPVASDSMFLSSTAYASTGNSPFVFSVSISESLFWVYNNQQPITRTAEAAFKTLLYIIMLLEVFGLAFLIFKLVKPLIHCAGLKWKGKQVKKVWDRPDSSDEEEEDWLQDILYGDEVKAATARKQASAQVSARGEHAVRDLTDEQRAERLKARQERRDGRASARVSSARQEADGEAETGRLAAGSLAHVEMTSPEHLSPPHAGSHHQQPQHAEHQHHHSDATVLHAHRQEQGHGQMLLATVED